MEQKTSKAVASNLLEGLTNRNKPRRMKVKTLIKYFGYIKRTEDSATRITEAFAECGVILYPSIMKMGDDWQLKIDDYVQLSITTGHSPNVLDDTNFEIPISNDWNQDGWFDTLSEKNFRTEKEVESKFIIPLFERLGYNENDRYDGMSVGASHGVKKTHLTVDFAFYNSTNTSLLNQPLLIVEAKKCINDFSIEKEFENARVQLKSYSFWVSCHYGLVTDGNKIEVLELFPLIGGIGGKKVVFECYRKHLKIHFQELHNLICKERLTLYYEKHLVTQ